MTTDTRSTFQMNVADLPAALRNLVKLTGKRPKVVELSFTMAPAAVHTSHRTGKIVSLGKELSQSDAGWVGSDGESNSSTRVVFSGPVAMVRKAMRSGFSDTVEIVCGGVSGPTSDLLTNFKGTAGHGSFPAMSNLESIPASVLAVAVDEALAGV